MVINPYIFKREPNTFIGGLSLSTKEMMATELSVSVSNVKAFSYDAINDVASCFVKNINLFNANDGKYNGNNDLISFVSSATGILRPYNEFRNANSVVEIRLPNLTYSNQTLANSFNIQCANLETLDIRSITRLQHNYIYSAPKLTELNVENVVYADKGAIRGVPLLMLIDMKKCKFLGTDASAEPTNPIFTGLNPNVTINLNYALMTSNGGDVDIYVVGLKVAYPNCTINFYDDNGNFVETYNPNPPNEIDWTVHQLGTLINLQSVKTDKNNVWVAAGSGYQGSSTRLITSIDNGMTWSSFDTGNRVWSSIDTDENGVWVIVSSGGSAGVNSVLMSINNGVTWNQISGITKSYNCIATDKSGNWIGAGGKRILTSNDNGDSWFEYELSENVNINSISTDEKGTWIAVSSTGDNRILKSTDNGQTWDFIISPENNSWRSISNDKEGTWIAVSIIGDNRILKSTDNGVNWVVQNSIENNSWTSISTDEKGTWIAVSSTGDNRLLISRDNGLTWSVESTPENNPWRSISTDTNGIWIGVSDSGTNQILKGIEVY